MTWPSSPPPEPYVLRLFVAGASPRSQRAISIMRRLCDGHLAGLCDFRVIDVYADPEATRHYQIVATPTLVKVSPAPLRRVVGDLSDAAKLLSALGVAPIAAVSEPLP
jgi:circadian clock protein KaiB